jgi:hypothetical protein
MKKGKTSKIIGFPSAKITYGTVDSKNLKSLYLNLQSWVTPIDEFENWERIVSNLSKSIKNSVFEVIDTQIYKPKYIVDLDLRTSGIVYGKKSFMNLEVTLFLEKELDFKDPQIKDSLKKISRNIYVENFMKNEYFDFAVSKKVKEM